MPRPENEEQAKVAKLTAAELEAELAKKQKEVEEIRKREQEAAVQAQKDRQKLQQANLDKLIEALTENEGKIQAARNVHEKRSASKNASVVAQADIELRNKLAELESAMNVIRQGLDLPYGCPRKLEEVKAFKVNYLKTQSELAARQKTAEADAKKQADKYKAQDELNRLQNEKFAREQKEKKDKIDAHDKKLEENANTKYSVWHKTIGAVIAIAIYFAISPVIPATAAAYALLAGAALFGAGIGGLYRNSVIEAGKVYRFKEDLDKVDNYRHFSSESRVSALKAGVEAATWKGYFNSFRNAAAYGYTEEFKAGMIQAVTENEEVVNAIRNHK